MNLIKRYNIDRLFRDELAITLHKPDSESGFKLTNLEKQILELIPEDFRYMARDEDGDLCIYDVKPCRQQHRNGVWSNYKKDGKSECIPLNGVFEFVRWENAEPWDFRYDGSN